MYDAIQPFRETRLHPYPGGVSKQLDYLTGEPLCNEGPFGWY